VAILRAYGSLRADGALVRLLIGEFISSIGDWLYLVALLVVVYERSEDAALLGIVGAARVLPYVVFSVPAGYIADRYDRRLVLLSTDIARGTIMVALAALVTVDGPLWAIVALAILATCFSSFFGPTIGAFLPTLVGDESRLGPANSAWASLDNLAFIVGPAIGGLLIAASGLGLAFALNAISFAVVAVILWRLPSGIRGDGRAPSATTVGATTPAPGDGRASGDAEAMAQASPAADPVDIAAGRVSGPAPEPGYIVPLVGLGALNVVSSFAFGGLSILTVVLASSAFGTSEAATGYLNAAIGVGGVVGAILAGGLVLRPRLAPALVGGAILLAIGLAVLGLVGSLAPALVAMAIASAGSLTVEVVDATIFQRIVPDAVRGRALGVIATVATLAYAGGAFAVPTLAGPVGVTAILTGSAIAVVVTALLAAVAIGSAGTRAPDPDTAIVRRVAGLPVFAGVGPARLEAILGRRRMRDVTAGEAIVRQGDQADRFFVILDGDFDVSRADEPGAPAERLRTLSRDDVFGELGLLTGEPRSATVTARTAGRLLELEGADFLELVGSGPDLSSRLLGLYRGAPAKSLRGLTPAVVGRTESAKDS
jgi:MFS family permease